MKRTKQLVLMLAAGALLIASHAVAHGEKPHGEPVLGTVTSVAAESMTIETDAGPVPVTLTPATTFATGETTVDRAAIKTGMHVMVHGNKLPGGGIAAQSVMLHDEEPPKESQHMHLDQ